MADERAKTGILLAGQMFPVSLSEADSARRKAYFEKGAEFLTDDEIGLLKALGMQVGDAMMESLRPYLATFFDALPGCQTDLDVYLKKDCEVPYFVLWSILFGDYTQTERRLSEARAAAAESATNLEIADSVHAAKSLGLPAARTAPGAAAATARAGAAPGAAAATARAAPDAAALLTDDALIRAIFTLYPVASDSALRV